MRIAHEQSAVSILHDSAMCCLVFKLLDDARRRARNYPFELFESDRRRQGALPSGQGSYSLSGGRRRLLRLRLRCRRWN